MEKEINELQSTIEESFARGTKRKDKEKGEPEKGGEAPPAPPQKKFRLNSGQLFLTYPKCPITKEDALLQITNKVGEAKEYLVAEEEHEVGEHKWPCAGFLSASDYMQWSEARAMYNKLNLLRSNK